MDGVKVWVTHGWDGLRRRRRRRRHNRRRRRRLRCHRCRRRRCSVSLFNKRVLLQKKR